MYMLLATNADLTFAVDLTMNAGKIPRAAGTPVAEASTAPGDESNIPDEERGLASPHAVPLSVRSSNGVSTAVADEETELRTRPSSISSSTGGYLKRKTSQLLGAVTSSGGPEDAPLAPRLAALVESYASSPIAAEIKDETEEVSRHDGNGNGEMRDVAVESSLLRGRKRASWGTQFKILSGRAFKNLYRDPALLTAHYLSSILVACERLEVPLNDGLWLTLTFSNLRALFP